MHINTLYGAKISIISSVPGFPTQGNKAVLSKPDCVCTFASRQNG